MKNIIISIALLICVLESSAQTIINDAVTQNRVYMRVGIEPTTMITFGYQRNVNVGILKQKITTYGEWSSSTARFGFKNSELKVGAILPLYQKGSFKVVNNLYLTAGSVDTKHFESKKFTVGNEVAIGLYKNNWFVATTMEYEKIYLNHIEHTDFYRTTYYEDAQDGWYKGGGGMFQFGVEGGITIKNNYDVHLEVKKPYTEKFNGYGGAPLHVNLGLGYKF